MKGISSSITRGLPLGAFLNVADNSGAKILKIVSVKKIGTTKGRLQAAGVGDIILASVVKGNPEMRKKVVEAVVIRQKKEYRRLSGLRVKFEDNSAVVIKDEFGNLKGTVIKGPVAKEACDRWPAIARLASIIY
ncbi:MAG TPA: 50S ribosomal protein L14 [Candidatus Woesearchaeota archaeon]|nr:50S ribosomal protein L14 [Candidatus Woesearchaeota archaeon]